MNLFDEHLHELIIGDYECDEVDKFLEIAFDEGCKYKGYNAVIDWLNDPEDGGYIKELADMRNQTPSDYCRKILENKIHHMAHRQDFRITWTNCELVYIELLKKSYNEDFKPELDKALGRRFDKLKVMWRKKKVKEIVGKMPIHFLVNIVTSYL